MQLKNSIDLPEFLAACKSCQGQVLFISPEGDQLNLKSQLSAYVFAAMAPDQDLILSGQIQTQNPQDLAKIIDFLR